VAWGRPRKGARRAGRIRGASQLGRERNQGPVNGRR
jgi:hypothetical protein